MPELPDVESYKRYLDATSLHQSIQAVHVQQPSVLRGASPQALGRRLHKHRFEQSRRHGKYLFVELDTSDWLLMHFGMTGRLQYFKSSSDTPDYTDVLFKFDNGFHLAYIAPRKLGRVGLISNPDRFTAEQRLGPDALQFTFADFRESAAGRRGSVKCWLMNQRVIAGIGNVYSDEILFQAGLHPKTPVNKLKEDQRKGLYKAMRRVLKTASNARADPEKMPASYLLIHRKQGGHCPKCNTAVKSVPACGRTAWLCPYCQSLPPYRD